MSISSELLTLNNTKTAIRTAINNKGGSVEASTPFADYATAITNLPSGGGNKLLTSIDVSDFSGTTFSDAKTYITDVTIPSGVTSIGVGALSGSKITNITIPSTVTTIGDRAFSGCTMLTGNMNIKGSFGERAFNGCSGLTSLTFTDSNTSLGYAVFDGCTSVTSVNVDSLETWMGLNFTNVQNYPYGNPLSLSQHPALNVNGTTLTGELSIPNTVTSVKNGTFYGYTRITSLVMPNTVTSIGHYSFMGCTGLTTVTIGSGVTSIGAFAFKGCTGLTTVTIPDSVTTIGENAFSDTNSPINVTIGSGVTSIGKAAFQNIGANGSVTINRTTPPTLGGDYVFWGTYPIYVPSASVDTYKAASRWSDYASRIVAIGDAITFTPTNGDPSISVKNYELATANYVQSTDVPSTIKNGAGSLEVCEGVTRIGTFVFQNGSSLTSVTIPSTITRIDNAAFDGCSSLTSVTVNATTPPTLYAAAFDNTNNCPIYVPAESVATYQAASGWSTYASRIQAIPSPSITITEYEEQEVTNGAVDFGDFPGCVDDDVVVDSFAAASANSTFDSDLKAANIIVVEDDNGNDITSQCTFSSPDFSKWDSTQDPSWDGESPATYEWQAGDTIASGDSQTPGSVSITATFGVLTDTVYLEYSKTDDGCGEPEPEPDPEEEPEE